MIFNGLTAHVAGDVDDLGQQRCVRCGKLIARAAFWRPGRVVAVSENGSVVAVVAPDAENQYAECAGGSKESTQAK